MEHSRPGRGAKAERRSRPVSAVAQIIALRSEGHCWRIHYKQIIFGIARSVDISVLGAYSHHMSTKHRQSVVLTAPQSEQLKMESERLGIGVNELLRRIVDLYFEGRTER